MITANIWSRKATHRQPVVGAMSSTSHRKRQPNPIPVQVMSRCLSPSVRNLDCDEAIDAIDALRDISLAMLHDIQRSDAKQPKLLVKELFGI